MGALKFLRRSMIYVFLILLAFIMIYPMFWMFASSFKPNEEIFTSLSLFPKNSTGLTAYVNGLKGTGQYSYATFFKNTFVMVIPTVLFTIISSVLTAYGFARFNFRFKKPLFAMVIGTLLLPQEVLIVPRYLLFNKFGWLNSFLPFFVPAMLATYSFFIFMMVQFIRGIPKDIDEAAYIDGCNSFRIFIQIIVPLCKPAIFSVAIFQTVWRWNDFFGPLLYITSVSKYPVSLALRMAIEAGETVYWNQSMALSLVCMLPPVVLYLVAQRYFIDGISTSGLKG